MFFIFYKTNDVFAAEERLANAEIDVEVVPTPVQDKAYCGVCVQIKQHDKELAKQVLSGMEYIEVK